MNKLECWGKTSHEITKICYTWTVENFGLLRNMEYAKGLKSPKFPNDESGFQFFLELFPEESQYEKDLLVGLNTVSINSTIQLKGCVKMYLPGRAADFSFRNFILSEPKILNFNNFFNERGPLLHNDKLILHCEITLIGNRLEKSGKGNFIKIPKCKLAEDLGVILNTQEFADVTLVTADGHVIPVHKNILSARSKVFAAMFKHPMKENTKNCVVINDFNFNVVSELIRYMYTGEAPNLQKMSADLLAAADKYELDRLKAMCEKSMSDNLSIETARIVLETAELYGLKCLRSTTIQFIQNNIHDVCDTFNLKSLLPTLVEQKVNEIKEEDDSSNSIEFVK